MDELQEFMANEGINLQSLLGDRRPTSDKLTRKFKDMHLKTESVEELKSLIKAAIKSRKT